MVRRTVFISNVFRWHGFKNSIHAHSRVSPAWDQSHDFTAVRGLLCCIVNCHGAHTSAQYGVHLHQAQLALIDKIQGVILDELSTLHWTPKAMN